MNEETIDLAALSPRQKDFMRRLLSIHTARAFAKRTRFWNAVAVGFTVIAATVTVVALRDNWPPLMTWYLGLILGWTGRVVFNALWENWQWPILEAVIDWKRVESIAAGVTK